MADEGPPVARVVGGKPPRNREQPRPQTDLLKFFNADGGTTTGSCNLFKDSDGKPVFMCPGYNYAYRDSRLHASRCRATGAEQGERGVGLSLF